MSQADLFDEYFEFEIIFCETSVSCFIVVFFCEASFDLPYFGPSFCVPLLVVVDLSINEMIIRIFMSHNTKKYPELWMKMFLFDQSILNRALVQFYSNY